MQGTSGRRVLALTQVLSPDPDALGVGGRSVGIILVAVVRWLLLCGSCVGGAAALLGILLAAATAAAPERKAGDRTGRSAQREVVRSAARPPMYEVSPSPAPGPAASAPSPAPGRRGLRRLLLLADLVGLLVQPLVDDGPEQLALLALLTKQPQHGQLLTGGQLGGGADILEGGRQLRTGGGRVRLGSARARRPGPHRRR